MAIDAPTPPSSPALGELQSVIARLCTDAESLAAFQADPAAFAAHYSGDTARLLGEIDVARLQHFARSLRCKRAREAGRLMPFTWRALGDRFFDAFHAHADRVVPSGSRRPLADAMAFARDQAARSSDRAVRQAARFDWLSLNLAFRLKSSGGAPAQCHARPRRGVCLRFSHFDYEFPAISRHAAGQAAWPRRQTLVMFASAGGRSGVWYW
jgi:hypothetical protein